MKKILLFVVLVMATSAFSAKINLVGPYLGFVKEKAVASDTFYYDGEFYDFDFDYEVGLNTAGIGILAYQNPFVEDGLFNMFIATYVGQAYSADFKFGDGKSENYKIDYSKGEWGTDLTVAIGPGISHRFGNLTVGAGAGLAFYIISYYTAYDKYEKYRAQAIELNVGVSGNIVAGYQITDRFTVGLSGTIIYSNLDPFMGNLGIGEYKRDREYVDIKPMIGIYYR
jgi:hypothetical protein